MQRARGANRAGTNRTCTLSTLPSPPFLALRAHCPSAPPRTRHTAVFCPLLPLALCAGAEVVRLYEQVLGKAGFRKGMDLYFQRHDGQVRGGTAWWYCNLG